MKFQMLFYLTLFLLCSYPGMTQDDKDSTAAAKDRFYFTSGSEMIFSWPSIDADGLPDGAVVRWAPVLNLQSHINYDLSDHIGLFSGLGVRNVGFIYDTAEDGVRKKHRTYNVSIPVGLKLGRIDKAFLYGGYELEVPFHYKEKTFIYEEKTDKLSTWFSKRVRSTQHAVFAGIQFPYGGNIKFKAYLSEFFDQQFQTKDSNGDVIRPYEGLKVNIFYISLCFDIFRDTKFNF